MNVPVEIPLSQRKLVTTASLSLVFVGLGCWMLADPRSSGGLVDSPLLRLLVGSTALLFFGMSFLFSLRRLLGKKPGLVIDAEGFRENVSAAALGPVSWREVTGMRRISVMGHNFLIIDVIDPERFLQLPGSFFARQSRRQNYKQYGSPVAVSVHGLACSLNELERLLREKWAAFKNAPEG